MGFRWSEVQILSPRCPFQLSPANVLLTPRTSLAPPAAESSASVPAELVYMSGVLRTGYELAVGIVSLDHPYLTSLLSSNIVIS